MTDRQEEIHYYFNDRIGWLRLHANKTALTDLAFVSSSASKEKKRLSRLMEQLIDELDAYFSGVPVRFMTPVNILAGAPFCRVVWQALQDIPYGQTMSYAGVAASIGRPLAARAVGSAVGKNPVPIIIPCHRVIKSDGSLGGYGPGIDVKKKLLDLEMAAGMNEQ